MKILFICDGNICRSPAAAAFLKANLNNNNIEVRSAGIYASAGRPMISLMQQVLQEHGLDSEHSSQKISSEHLTWADLIFTMTRPQKFILLSMVPTMADKVFTLQEYINNPAQDISVPRAKTIEAYRACAEFIQGGCQALY
ncbi:MAG: low molecular weight protein arginine phosphatase [Cyanobacteria bacterium P01_F01_bin.116]